MQSNQRAPKTDYSKIAEHYDNVRPTPADIWLSKIIDYGKIVRKEPVCYYNMKE